MGQAVEAVIDVEETKVHCRIPATRDAVTFRSTNRGDAEGQGQRLAAGGQARLGSAETAGVGMRHFAIVGSDPRASTRRGAGEGLWRERPGRYHRPLSVRLRPDPLRRCPGSSVAEGSIEALRPGRGRRRSATSATSRSGAMFRPTNCAAFTMRSSWRSARRLTASSESRRRCAGVVGSAEFVGWYNGHPDFVDLAPPLDGTHAAVIGNGNVALDCARILSKNHHEFEVRTSSAMHWTRSTSAVQTITIVGPRSHKSR